MRKFILMALAGVAIALAVPEFASATPLVARQRPRRRGRRRVDYRRRCGIAAGTAATAGIVIATACIAATGAAAARW